MRRALPFLLVAATACLAAQAQAPVSRTPSAARPAAERARNVILFIGDGMGFEHVQAGRGTPGSSEFGYGATIEMDGPYFGDALALATDLPLDWLAIALDCSFSGA